MVKVTAAGRFLLATITLSVLAVGAWHLYKSSNTSISSDVSSSNVAPVQAEASIQTPSTAASSPDTAPAVIASPASTLARPVQEATPSSQITNTPSDAAIHELSSMKSMKK